ncbi:hypothetical protein BGZ94_003538, partial [Podila epigama]
MLDLNSYATSAEECFGSLSKSCVLKCLSNYIDENGKIESKAKTKETILFQGSQEEYSPSPIAKDVTMTCPQCQRGGLPLVILDMDDIRPSKFVERIIRRHQIRCPTTVENSCQWIGSTRDIEKHLASCDFMRVRPCPCHRFGCTFKGATHVMMVHLMSCQYYVDESTTPLAAAAVRTDHGHPSLSSSAAPAPPPPPPPPPPPLPPCLPTLVSSTMTTLSPMPRPPCPARTPLQRTRAPLSPPPSSPPFDFTPAQRPRHTPWNERIPQHGPLTASQEEEEEDSFDYPEMDPEVLDEEMERFESEGLGGNGGGDVSQMMEGLDVNDGFEAHSRTRYYEDLPKFPPDTPIASQKATESQPSPIQDSVMIRRAVSKGQSLPGHGHEKSKFYSEAPMPVQETTLAQQSTPRGWCYPAPGQDASLPPEPAPKGWSRPSQNTSIQLTNTRGLVMPSQDELMSQAPMPSSSSQPTAWQEHPASPTSTATPEEDVTTMLDPRREVELAPEPEPEPEPEPQAECEPEREPEPEPSRRRRLIASESGDEAENSSSQGSGKKIALGGGRRGSTGASSAMAAPPMSNRLLSHDFQVTQQWVRTPSPQHHHSQRTSPRQTDTASPGPIHPTLQPESSHENETMAKSFLPLLVHTPRYTKSRRRKPLRMRSRTTSGLILTPIVYERTTDGAQGEGMVTPDVTSPENSLNDILSVSSA